MRPNSLDALNSPDALEAIAAVEHERWSHWQRYLHEQCQHQPDGSLTIPAELAARWDLQMRTPYADLSDTEKESDREQAREYLRTLTNYLTTTQSETDTR